ncbi:MAG: hypothetical protein HY863_07080 [Chloroflexi bacterium]|nr:hypothetical protein [Chloroflexota bacterium]
MVKKKNSKWISLLIILKFVAIAGMILSACGGGDNSDSIGTPLQFLPVPRSAHRYLTELKGVANTISIGMSVDIIACLTKKLEVQFKRGRGFGKTFFVPRVDIRFDF